MYFIWVGKAGSKHLICCTTGHGGIKDVWRNEERFSSPVLESAGILLAVAEKNHDYGDIIPKHRSEIHNVSSVGEITGFPMVVGKESEGSFTTGEKDGKKMAHLRFLANGVAAVKTPHNISSSPPPRAFRIRCVAALESLTTKCAGLD